MLTAQSFHLIIMAVDSKIESFFFASNCFVLQLIMHNDFKASILKVIHKFIYGYYAHALVTQCVSA